MSFRRNFIGALYVVAAIASLSFYFRHLFIFRLDRVSGDIGDARIVMIILEHWRNVFLGYEVWHSPIFFYPAAHVLGNTDAYFLYAPIFAVFRALGCDVYLSYEFTLVVVKATGFLGMAWLSRSILSLPHWASILGAVLFTIFSASYVRVSHAQLLTIAFVPFIVIGLFNYCRYLDREPVRSFFCGAGAVALLALLLFTSFYIGWFFIVFSLCCVAAALLVAEDEFAKFAGPVLRLCWRRLPSILLIAGVFGLFITPFILLYLPKLSETGGQPYAFVLGGAQDLYDVVHINPDNLVWGPLLTPIFSFLTAYQGRSPYGETGFSPLLLVVFASTMALTFRQYGRPLPARRDLTDYFILIFGLSTALLWFMSIRLGNVSLWWFVYRFFPGGSAMRVPGRLLLFLAVFVIPVAVIGLHKLRTSEWLHRLARGNAIVSTMIVAAISAVLVIEQVTLLNVASISRKEENFVFDAVRAPPDFCKMFFVSRSASNNANRGALADGAYGANLDAVIIAEKYHVPTFNGWSTWEPQGWNLPNPEVPDYAQSVDYWIRVNNLSAGICGLDLQTGKWSKWSLKGL